MEGAYKCKSCGEDYNLSERLPKILFPCGHTACEQCLQSKNNPQDYKQKLCPMNHENPQQVEYCISNNSLIEEIKNNFGLFVYCSNHKNKRAELYDEIKQALVCMNCAFQYQKNILQTKNVEQDVINMAQQILKRTQQYDEHLRKLLKENDQYRKFAHSFVNKTQSFDGSTCIEQLKAAKAYLKRRNIDIEWEQNAITGSFQKFQDSFIISQNKNFQELLLQWIDPKYKHTKLLYRGSRDGFKAVNFHDKCDYKGATVTLIRTTEDFYFGGFTSKNWQSLNPSQYIHDEQAFLFSLTRSQKYPIKETGFYAIRNDEQYLPVFGYGDLYIYSDCNLIYKSGSSFGNSYKSLSDQKDFNLLAGSPQFKVKEVEIYQVKEE